MIRVLIFFFFLIAFQVYPQGFIKLNNSQQHVVVLGTGEPAVIFINGLGSDQSDFRYIQKRAAKKTMTVSYDRPGIGKSEAADTERSIDVLADELHDLIGELKIKGKYILAGHSMAGYIMRFYCFRYPGEVSGLLFIDPSHEDFYESKLRVRSEAEQIELKRKSFDFPESAPSAIKNEFKHFMTTDVDLVRKCEIPDDIPVTLLTAMRITKKETQDPWRKRDLETWMNLHKNWLKDAPQIRHVITTKSGHSIHQDEPDLVIRELEALITAVKSTE